MLGLGDAVPDVLVWTAPREEARPLRQVLGAGLAPLCFYVFDWDFALRCGPACESAPALWPVGGSA